MSAKQTLGVILAAGASRRFGSADKLGAILQGRPLLDWAAQALINCPQIDQRLAILSNPQLIKTLPAGISPHLIAPDQDMAQSFRTAITLAERSGYGQMVVMLGDMPFVSPQSLSQLVQAPISCASCFGQTRLPPLKLMAQDFALAKAGASGDQGARLFLRSLPQSALIALPAHEALDFDTQEALASANRHPLHPL